MPRAPPSSTLFPYTKLFRSEGLSQSEYAFASQTVVAGLNNGVAAGVTVVEAGHHGLRSEEHTSELHSRPHLVCLLLLEKKNAARLNERHDVDDLGLVHQ